MPQNNSQKRRAAKIARKIDGKKVAYNPDANRNEKRRVLYSVVKCEACGERILFKNLAEHIRRAMLHVDMAKELSKRSQ